MISKEQAEQVARQAVLARRGRVKARVLHTSFFDPEEFIRTRRFILDPAGMIDRDMVGPAHWGVALEVVATSDDFLRRLRLINQAHGRELFLKFPVLVDVDPESGRAVVRKTCKVVRLCDRSEL